MLGCCNYVMDNLQAKENVEPKLKCCDHVVDISLLKCVNKLTEINNRRSHTSIEYGIQATSYRSREKKLKKTICNALFLRSLRNKYEKRSLQWRLLNENSWDAELVCAAIAFRACCTERRFNDSDKLLELFRKVYQEGGGKFVPVLQVLLYLSSMNNNNKAKQRFVRREFVSKIEAQEVLSVKTALQYGDTKCPLFLQSYQCYPEWIFHSQPVDKPLEFSPYHMLAICDIKSGISSESEEKYQNVFRSLRPKNGLLKGLHSHVFSQKGDRSDSFTKQSWQTLYGGLVHSRTASMNVSLLLPEISRTNQLDLCQHLPTATKPSAVENVLDEDEGFVSRGTSPSVLSPCSATTFSDTELELQCSFYEDNEPYAGYRAPKYDVSAWNECLTVPKSNHRTWETIGRPAGSTKCQPYLTEAGSRIFDVIWKQRWQIVVELATAICKESGAKGLRPPSKYQWIDVDEAVLIRDAILVSAGIVSETFQFNTASPKNSPRVIFGLDEISCGLHEFYGQDRETTLNALAHMYLPNKKVHISGVTAVSTASILCSFAEWGTSYWRLLRFASAGLAATSTTSYNRPDRGVIFKAFCDGIRSYLHQYQQNVLNLSQQVVSLQQLAFTFRRLGAQIRYISRLCKCGSPDSPLEHMESLTHPQFPTGIGILTYIYEEAVHCTQTTDYLVLLYLLRKCCQPYLQFVQTWVFRGSCWDMTGEFMLRVNAKNFVRRDRRRWSGYIEAVAPNDVTSCVPSFLSPVAEDILMCGKTVELMQLICPEHFLCTQPVPIPTLLLTFSTTRMQELMVKWRNFEYSVDELERERTVFWEKKEKELKMAKREKIRRAREALDEQSKEIESQQQKAKDEMRQLKLKELQRLKQQAEDGVKRKLQNRQDEKDADARWQQEVADRDAERKEHEDAILQEAKQEMISHYNELYEEAERRRAKAEWKIKRHRLQNRRLQDMQQKTWPPDSGTATNVERVERDTADDVTHNDPNTPESKHDDLHSPIQYSHASYPSVPSTRQRVEAEGVSAIEPVPNLPEVSTSPEATETSVKPAAVETLSSAPLVTDRALVNSSVAVNTTYLDGRSTVAPFFAGGRPSELTNTMTSEQSKNFSGKVGPGLQDAAWPVGERELVQRQGNNVSRPKNLAYQSVPGRHSSQSSVQNLMYYQSVSPEPGGVATKKPLRETNTSSLLYQAVQGGRLKPKQHTSDSSVQLLMYPVKSTSEQNDVIVDSTTAFELDPPACDPYDNNAIFNKLNSGKIDDLRSSVDLYGAVMSDTYSHLGNDDYDDVDDLLDQSGGSVTIDLHALPILLRNCVLRPIKAHAALANRCVVNYFMVELGMPRHFEALRHFLLLEDGEFGQTLSNELFEMIHSGSSPNIVLNPISLGSTLSRAIMSSGQGDNNLTSNLNVVIKHLPPAFNLTDLRVLDCVELRYSVGWPCNIVLTESCHSKYNLVLSFLLQLKHVVWSLHDTCMRLNRIAAGQPPNTRISRGEVRKLHIYRHEMHNFVKVMQGYVSTQVLHVCWTEFQESLRNKVETLEDLHLRHAEYINRCVLRCLLTPKAQNVMNVIGDALKCILRFRNQLATATSSFSSLHKTFMEFTRYSNFLYRVVTKLVERGYQPHLEDFLIRLNFNGYYKT